MALSIAFQVMTNFTDCKICVNFNLLKKPKKKVFRISKIDLIVVTIIYMDLSDLVVSKFGI